MAGRSRRFVSALKDLQERLGVANDARVARELVARLLPSREGEIAIPEVAAGPAKAAYRKMAEVERPGRTAQDIHEASGVIEEAGFTTVDGVARPSVKQGRRVRIRAATARLHAGWRSTFAIAMCCHSSRRFAA